MFKQTGIDFIYSTLKTIICDKHLCIFCIPYLLYDEIEKKGRLTIVCRPFVGMGIKCGDYFTRILANLPPAVTT